MVDGPPTGQDHVEFVDLGHLVVKQQMPDVDLRIDPLPGLGQVDDRSRLNVGSRRSSSRTRDDRLRNISRQRDGDGFPSRSVFCPRGADRFSRGYRLDVASSCRTRAA